MKELDERLREKLKGVSKRRISIQEIKMLQEKYPGTYVSTSADVGDSVIVILSDVGMIAPTIGVSLEHIETYLQFMRDNKIRVGYRCEQGHSA
jgi:hypothetical protein